MDVLELIWSLTEKNIFFILIHFVYIVSACMIREIKSPLKKKWISTIIGLLNVAIVVQREHIWHLFTALTICCFIIANSPKKKVHILTTITIFIYASIIRLLLYSKISSIYTLTNIWLMSMMIKIVGVAFDIHLSHTEKIKDIRNNESEINPGFWDIFHYVFSIFGANIGPYLRYRTYQDFLYLQFGSKFQYIDLVKKFTKFCMIGIIFIIIYEMFPFDYLLTNSFMNSSQVYKIYYMVMLHEVTIFRIASVLGLSECITNAAGIGYYPKECCSVPGHGPIKNYEKIKSMSSETISLVEFDCNTIKTMDIVKCHTSLFLGDILRHWNLTNQYFLAMYFYKQSLNTRFKIFRHFYVGFISALWHGVEIGNFICLFIVWPWYTSIVEPHFKFYLNRSNGWKNIALTVLILAIRIYIVACASISFFILYLDFNLAYLKAVNYVPIVVCILLQTFSSVSSLSKQLKIKNN